MSIEAVGARLNSSGCVSTREAKLTKILIIKSIVSILPAGNFEAITAPARPFSMTCCV
jgi:hypothetical protein